MAKNQMQKNKCSTLSLMHLMQCIVLSAICVALLYLLWTWSIEEAMILPDCLPSLVFMLIQLKISLSSNPVFWLVLCNVIIVTLLVDSGFLCDFGKSCERHNFYLKESQPPRTQVVAEPVWIEKENALDEDCVDYKKAQKWSTKNCVGEESDMEGGDSCNENCEQKSMEGGDPSMAIVQYQASNSADELNRRCDEFIADFRRKMSLQMRDN